MAFSGASPQYCTSVGLQSQRGGAAKQQLLLWLLQVLGVGFVRWFVPVADLPFCCAANCICAAVRCCVALYFAATAHSKAQADPFCRWCIADTALHHLVAHLPAAEAAGPGATSPSRGEEGRGAALLQAFCRKGAQLERMSRGLAWRLQQHSARMFAVAQGAATDVRIVVDMAQQLPVSHARAADSKQQPRQQRQLCKHAQQLACSSSTDGTW